MPAFDAEAVLKSLVDLRNVCQKIYQDVRTNYDRLAGKLQSTVTDLVSTFFDEDYATVLEKANEDILEKINSQLFSDNGAGGVSGSGAGGGVAGGSDDEGHELFNSILEFVRTEHEKYTQQTTILRTATGNIGIFAVVNLTADSPLDTDVSLKLKVEKLLNYVYKQRGLINRKTGCSDDSYFTPSDERVAIYVFELMNGEPEYQASEYSKEMLEKSILNYGKVPNTTPTTVSKDYVSNARKLLNEWQDHKRNGTGPFYQETVCAPWPYGAHGPGMDVDESDAGGGSGTGGMGGGKKRKSKKQSKKQSKKSKRSKKSSKRKTRR